MNVSRVACILSWLLLCLTSRTFESREMSNGESSDRLPGNNFGSCTDGKCIKRTTQEITSGMWFGPRLGRRRRSGERPEVGSPDDIEALANALDGARWTLVKIPANDKRQPTQFTPRLGRGSSEDLFSYAPGDALDRSEENDHPSPPLFAPRLGRRLPWAPSPRLGRQLRNALRKM
ncbi:PBAN-type neuropeptides isoform X2 [Harpegnathos saltator]|uniref:PBAN-type neuropeptides isoform X2 n=1 Tax=Harpegnathos saltator TaxID=610380 RepID=UPI000DBED206|nr:PBAN-type neuropeptides isoform X2 [Harpegnathos saltator]